MNELEFLTMDLEKKGSIDKAYLEEVLKSFDFKLPNDYLQFISNHNGAEGSINVSYLQLLPIEELEKINIKYETDKYAPGYFIFGSNLGGTAYAFKKSGDEIVSFEFSGMLISDAPDMLAKDFTGFLRKLYES